MIKRVFLFVLTNILVMATISIVLSLLGVRGYLDQSGINYESLLIICGVWGMGGAFISLMLSKQMAKWMMRVEIIDPTGARSRDVVDMVHRMAQAAGLPKMPEVGIYDSSEVNAFATGPSKSNALVAVSTGLLNRMNRSEVEGVIGHEIAHIANGDMVTMTLIQGVVNAFTMFLARILGFFAAQAMRGDDERPNYLVQHMFVIVFDILFTILGSIVVATFSRRREYRADKGGAQYAGRSKMIGALQALQRSSGMVDTSHEAVASLKISGKPKGLIALFMTHPPLEDRIAKLQQYA